MNEWNSRRSVNEPNMIFRKEYGIIEIKLNLGNYRLKPKWDLFTDY